jgi:hypothetical protein
MYSRSRQANEENNGIFYNTYDTEIQPLDIEEGNDELNDDTFGGDNTRLLQEDFDFSKSTELFRNQLSLSSDENGNLFQDSRKLFIGKGYPQSSRAYEAIPLSSYNHTSSYQAHNANDVLQFYYLENACYICMFRFLFIKLAPARSMLQFLIQKAHSYCRC